MFVTFFATICITVCFALSCYRNSPYHLSYFIFACAHTCGCLLFIFLFIDLHFHSSVLNDNPLDPAEAPRRPPILTITEFIIWQDLIPPTRSCWDLSQLPGTNLHPLMHNCVDFYTAVYFILSNIINISPRCLFLIRKE